MTASMIYVVGALLLIAASGSRGGAVSMLIVLLALLFWRPVRPWGFLGLAIVLALLTVLPLALDVLARRFAEGDLDAGAHPPRR